MTNGYNYAPPIESGLNGDRSPEQDLEAFADSIDEMHRPGVYAIKLSVPHDWEVVEKRWDRYTDKEMPQYVQEAFESNVVVYVGASKDVLSRLHQHLRDTNQSTIIASVFPLHSLFEVWWFDDKDEAFLRENGIAMKLDNTYPGLYVHSR